VDTVRDTLNNEKSARKQNAQDLEIGESSALGENVPGLGGNPKNLDQDDQMMARLREVADQRTAMAQNEVDRLQNQIGQLQQRMEELTKMQLPPGTLAADLKDAMQRLDDANANLARAHEAKENTELASSMKQEHQESTLHLDHATHQGVTAGGPEKVGAVMGRNSAQPKVPLRKQHSHGIH
jgi:TolA-binding protein